MLRSLKEKDFIFAFFSSNRNLMPLIPDADNGRAIWRLFLFIAVSRRIEMSLFDFITGL